MDISFLTILLQVIGPLTILLVFVAQLAVNRRVTKREIYQRLEFAAIELFRFEISHSGVCDRLYNDEYPIGEKGRKKRREMINHVTQILNLFEMAVEFRKGKIISAEIFSTWIPWFWEMAQLRNFRFLWEELKDSYSPELQRIIHLGIGSGKQWDQYIASLYTMYKDRYILDLRKETVA